MPWACITDDLCHASAVSWGTEWWNVLLRAIFNTPIPYPGRSFVFFSLKRVLTKPGHSSWVHLLGSEAHRCFDTRELSMAGLVMPDLGHWQTLQWLMNIHTCHAGCETFERYCMEDYSHIQGLVFSTLNPVSWLPVPLRSWWRSNGIVRLLNSLQETKCDVRWWSWQCVTSENLAM